MRVARVLVVDDEPHILKLVSFTLEKNGHSVTTASDAMTGINMAREECPDLILMDVMMPVMNGLEALEVLKSDEQTKSVPVAMLSAKSQQYEQEEGIARGAVRYLCKPFTPKELASAVSNLLGKG